MSDREQVDVRFIDRLTQHIYESMHVMEEGESVYDEERIEEGMDGRSRSFERIGITEDEFMSIFGDMMIVHGVIGSITACGGRTLPSGHIVVDPCHLLSLAAIWALYGAEAMLDVVEARE
jgi:hypothetical protein